MFTVKRTMTYTTNNDTDIESYKCNTLDEAIGLMEKLRKADEVRYLALMQKYGNKFFMDYSNDKISYHYTVGRCVISCEITDGLIEDAEREFYISRQLNKY